MKSFLNSEAKKINDNHCQLRYRRINWSVETRHKIISKFKIFNQMAIDQNFPFSFFIRTHGTKNEEVIQLEFQSQKIGVTRTSNKYLAMSYEDSNQTVLIEKGACLVASQTAWGTVCFIASPLKSEILEHKDKEFILFYDLDPRDVTDKLIESAIKKYLLIIRSSSVRSNSNFSFADRLNLFLIEKTDVRKTNEIIRENTSKVILFLFSKFAPPILTVVTAYWGWLKFLNP